MGENATRRLIESFDGGDENLQVGEHRPRIAEPADEDLLKNAWIALEIVIRQPWSKIVSCVTSGGRLSFP